MQSAIFSGQIKHRRFYPVKHTFRYRVFMMFIDLAEIDQVFTNRWLWSTKRIAIARFKREDHVGDNNTCLDECVRDLVEQHAGIRPTGPIRLLTNLRYFGYCFNPVSFYYCYDAKDKTVETIVAEVNNTPWGERHCYVLPTAGNCSTQNLYTFQPKKVMHVSPFMPMDIDYTWRFSQPTDRLTVFMTNDQQQKKIFDASLDLARTDITACSLAKTLARYPFMTFSIIFGIHWQALKLWIKKCPIYDHPKKTY